MTRRNLPFLTLQQQTSRTKTLGTNSRYSSSIPKAGLSSNLRWEDECKFLQGLVLRLYTTTAVELLKIESVIKNILQKSRP